MSDLNATAFLSSSPIALAVALSACGDDEPIRQPMLTMEALVEAGEKCGARELEILPPAEHTNVPAFGYLDPGPLKDGQLTPTAVCLHKALEGYQYRSMTMRLTQSERAAR